MYIDCLLKNASTKHNKHVVNQKLELVDDISFREQLLNQGLLLAKLKSSLQKFYGHHYDLVDRYGISVSQMTTDMFHVS
jgi:hypothetical protein